MKIWKETENKEMLLNHHLHLRARLCCGVIFKLSKLFMLKYMEIAFFLNF